MNCHLCSGAVRHDGRPATASRSAAGITSVNQPAKCHAKCHAKSHDTLLMIVTGRRREICCMGKGVDICQAKNRFIILETLNMCDRSSIVYDLNRYLGMMKCLSERKV